jgi:glycosyltransferase involved in cell wall biosynthesis
MNAALMVAFHYPPCAGSSGIHRTLKFSRHLPAQGWRPVVLTAHPRAYERTGPEQLADIPPGTPVMRAFALDSGRHLAVRGRSLRATALPDRWASWWLGAVPAGLKLVRKHRPRVIWSTFPIATAHLIGLTLARMTGLPWIADFRDSMTEDHYPHHALTRRIYRSIERATVERAARIVFTAPSTLSMYRRRYPSLERSRCLVIPNGYDEDDFNDLPVWTYTAANGRPIRLLHAGLVYPEERDPRPFFRALSQLMKDGRLGPDVLRVDLRAAGSEQYFRALIQELELGDLVHLLPPLPYREALGECAAADALLILQAASCNHQIPAKVYEYLRIGRPMLALTAHEGDTAALLRETGGATVVSLHDEHAIAAALPGFLAAVRSAQHPLPEARLTSNYARHRQAIQLAQCFTACQRADGS